MGGGVSSLRVEEYRLKGGVSSHGMRSIVSWVRQLSVSGRISVL